MYRCMYVCMYTCLHGEGREWEEEGEGEGMVAEEGVYGGWYVSCREIPLSPHLLLWEFPILAALTENQMRCCTLNLS